MAPLGPIGFRRTKNQRKYNFVVISADLTVGKRPRTELMRIISTPPALLYLLYNIAVRVLARDINYLV